MNTTTETIETIADAVVWYARELGFASDAHEFTPELRRKVEAILGWNAEKALNIPEVFAERLAKAAQLIADTRRA